MQFKDYYQTLGVEPGAGDAEIKTAYRRLARKHQRSVYYGCRFCGYGDKRFAE